MVRRKVLPQNRAFIKSAKGKSYQIEPAGVSMTSGYVGTGNKVKRIIKAPAKRRGKVNLLAPEFRHKKPALFVVPLLDIESNNAQHIGGCGSKSRCDCK